jgi:hypothetical protein
MCAKQSLRQPARTTTALPGPVSSLAPGNTIRSGYHSWRVVPRGPARSPVRNDAGRSAKPEGSSAKVSSPVKHNVPEWPSKYVAAKATPTANHAKGTLGVQVHGMYRRLSQELGRSPSVPSLMRAICEQDVTIKFAGTRRREVRWFRSSKEVG